MPFFNYTARNKFGERVKGKAEARNIDEAASLLLDRNLLVISLKPITEGTFSFINHFFGGVKHNDVVNFTRQLSTMIGAGLSLSKALGVLVQQSTPSFTQVVAQVLQDVEGGDAFSKALSKHPKVFSQIYIQLVKAGEVGGVLDDVLMRLAINLEASKEFRAKTKGAMIYPGIVLLTMAVVMFVMMTFVVPQLTVMFEDFGAALPAPTRMLMAISDFFVNFWYVIIGGSILGFLIYRKWHQTKRGQRAVAGFVLKLPLLGSLLQKIVIADFVRTLSLLLTAGVTLLAAMEVVTDGVENILYREALEEVKDAVEKGALLSESLSRHEVFPPILYQMTAVGEETGKLDEVLIKLSEYFEQETAQAVKNLTTAMEPMIIIVLAIGVGLMVVAIIMPIYSLTSQF